MPRTRRRRVLVVSGPNLQLLGTREPGVYGTETLASIEARLMSRASELSVALDARQTNHEGVIVDWLGAAPGAFDGVLLNAGGYTHTSVAIRDAISAAALPCVEIHLTNTDAREPFRRRSLIAPVCSGRVMGFGGDSYLIGLDGLLRILARR